MRSALAILVLVACDSGAEKKPPAPTPPVPVAVVIDAAVAARTCDDVKPEHTAVESAQREAYTKALADQGMTELSLQSLEEIWQPMEEPRGEWPPELSATSVQHKGKKHAAIATRIQDWARGARRFELAVDAQGNVYQVIRQLVPTDVKHITVDACQWGCFGDPGSGAEPPPKVGRYVYVLAKGHVFKGERRVEYRAPRIEYTTTHTCAPPA